MKQIVLIFSLVMLLGIGPISAEILSGTDDFSQERWYKSSNFIQSDKEWVGLYKVFESNAVRYGILYSEEAMKQIKFSQKQADFKIDESIIKQVDVTKVSFTPTLTTGINRIGINVIAPLDLIEQIKTAKNVSMRFYKENGAPVVLILPEPVLAEWKEVIATEK